MLYVWYCVTAVCDCICDGNDDDEVYDVMYYVCWFSFYDSFFLWIVFSSKFSNIIISLSTICLLNYDDVD